MNFSQQLKELKRKTNLKGRELAEELGIGNAYFSQLLNGKQEPPERAPIRKAVERMLAAPIPAPGMRSFVVEVPERLYVAAVEAAQAQSFASVGEYIAQLIRDDTQRKPFLPSTPEDSRTSQEAYERAYAGQNARKRGKDPEN